MRYAHSVTDLVGNTPLVRLNHVTAGIRCDRAGEGRVLQSRRFGEGPHRAQHHRRRRARRAAAARRHDRRADERQHRRRTRADRPAARLPLRLRRARQGRRGQAGGAARLRRRGRRRRRPPSSPTTRARTTACRTDWSQEIPGAFKPNQYANQNGPRSHYEIDRARDLARHRRARHALRRRRRHGRHDHRRGPLPAGGVGGRRADRRRRPGGLDLLRRTRPRVRRRGRGRGLLADGVRPDRRRRAATGSATPSRSR